MKRNLLIIPILGFMLSCSGGTTESNEVPELTEEEVNAIEESTQSIDDVLQSTEETIDTLQNEVDKLLNDI